jgi:sirohydrochlorin ferrochelatase
VTQPPLVAVAHGSRDPAATAATRSLLDAIRNQRPDLTVHEAYLDHESPRLSDLAGTLSGPFVVVPLLLGAAYHSRVDIPAALAPAAGRAVQADVLGPDPLLLGALERRLREAGVQVGDSDTAVVLAAAGSADESSLEAVHELAARWRERGWWAVSAAFASAAEPSVEQAVADLRAAGAPRVAVASYLLFPGLFADRLAAAGADVTSGPLTDAPEIVALVLARYDAAAVEIEAAPHAAGHQQSGPPPDRL